MAERGGRRVPRNPASYSGVGARAKRTDQPLRSPSVQESTDLPQGSREQILQAQRVAPLSRTPTPSVQPAPARGNSPLAGGGAGRPLGPPPDHLMGIPTAREGEPLTEGLSVGPGAGPEVLAPEPTDEADAVLQAMVEMTGDSSIAQMLDEHREFKAWRAQRALGAPEQPMAGPEPIEAPEPPPQSDVDAELKTENPETTADITPVPIAEGGEEPEPTELLSEETGGDAEMV